MEIVLENEQIKGVEAAFGVSIVKITPVFQSLLFANSLSLLTVLFELGTLHVTNEL